MTNMGAGKKVKLLEELVDGLFRKMSWKTIAGTVRFNKIGNARAQQLQHEAAVCAIGAIQNEMIQNSQDMALADVMIRGRQGLQDAKLLLWGGICHGYLYGDILLFPSPLSGRPPR